MLDDPRLSASQRAAVLRCVPAEWDYWEVVARSQDDDNAYWQTAEMRVLPPDHMQYAIERLVACGRAWDAIDSVSLSIRSAKQEGVKTDLTADVLIGLLHVACTQKSVKISSLSYEVGQVLDHIVELKAGQVDVARLELLLLNPACLSTSWRWRIATKPCSGWIAVLHFAWLRACSMAGVVVQA